MAEDTARSEIVAAQAEVGVDPLAPAYRKGEHLRYEIARQVERNGDLTAALELYRQCRLPPSREPAVRFPEQRAFIEPDSDKSWP